MTQTFESGVNGVLRTKFIVKKLNLGVLKLSYTSHNWQRPQLSGRGVSSSPRLPGFSSRLDTRNFNYSLWPLPCNGRHFNPWFWGVLFKRTGESINVAWKVKSFITILLQCKTLFHPIWIYSSFIWESWNMIVLLLLKFLMHIVCVTFTTLCFL